MTVQAAQNPVNFPDKLTNVETLVLTLDHGVRWRIEGSVDNGLIMTKVEGSNPAIAIVPRMANQIKLV